MNTSPNRLLALVILMSAVFPLHALEVKLDDFVSIRWGATMDEAKTIMTSSKGLDVIQRSSDTTMLYFEGGTFGAWRAARWNLWFVDGKFHSGRVMVLVPGKRDRAYAEVKKTLTEKYGIPTRSESKGWPSTLWRIPATLSDKSEKEILLTDNPNEDGPRIQYSNVTMKKPEQAAPEDL
jgi:hypothetical protein